MVALTGIAYYTIYSIYSAICHREMGWLQISSNTKQWLGLLLIYYLYFGTITNIKINHLTQGSDYIMNKDEILLGKLCKWLK